VWFYEGDRISELLARLGQDSPTRTSSPAKPAATPPLAAQSGQQAPLPAAGAPTAAQPPPVTAPAAVSAPLPSPAPAVDPAPVAKAPPAADLPPAPAPPPEAAAPQATAPPRPAAPPPQVAPPPAPAREAFPLKDFVVFFAQNSTEIPVYANEQLATAAALMKGRPAVAAVIEGHTDSVGDPAYNRMVAENRAAAVRAFLVGQGVAPSRLTVTAFGSNKPIDTNGTPEGRSKNRRVVVRLVPEKP
jgi:outer membrane protein OmpA-like peptidoglycan-associated protein